MALLIKRINPILKALVLLLVDFCKACLLAVEWHHVFLREENNIMGSGSDCKFVDVGVSVVSCWPGLFLKVFS